MSDVRDERKQGGKGLRGRDVEEEEDIRGGVGGMKRRRRRRKRRLDRR